jgi:hypothetical protein
MMCAFHVKQNLGVRIPNSESKVNVNLGGKSDGFQSKSRLQSDAEIIAATRFAMNLSRHRNFAAHCAGRNWSIAARCRRSWPAKISAAHYRWLEIFSCSSKIQRVVGKTFHYECTQCQYRANLSGGADSGLNCDVQTIICRDCRELFDVFTRVRCIAGHKEFTRNFSTFVRPEIPPVVLRDSLFAPKPLVPREFEWQKMKLKCPAQPKHFVEPWKNPGRCPRCGAFMAQTGLPFRVWE